MNSTTVIVSQTVQEVCECTDISEDLLVEIVKQGIVEPDASNPQDWLFDSDMVGQVKKALRLHHDLEIDWAGVAFAIQLLNELDQLRTENRTLQQRLERFLRD